MQTVNSNLFVGGPKDGQIIPIEDRLGIVEFPTMPEHGDYKRSPRETIVYKRMAFRVGDAEIHYWAWVGMESSQIKITFFATNEEAEIE